jgi:hypothetical protein
LRLRRKKRKARPRISATAQIGPTTAPAIRAPETPLLVDAAGVVTIPGVVLLAEDVAGWDVGVDGDVIGVDDVAAAGVVRYSLMYLSVTNYILVLGAAVEIVLYTIQFAFVSQFMNRSPDNSAPLVDATIPVTHEYPDLLQSRCLA